MKACGIKEPAREAVPGYVLHFNLRDIVEAERPICPRSAAMTVSGHAGSRSPRVERRSSTGPSKYAPGPGSRRRSNQRGHCHAECRSSDWLQASAYAAFGNRPGRMADRGRRMRRLPVERRSLLVLSAKEVLRRRGGVSQKCVGIWCRLRGCAWLLRAVGANESARPVPITETKIMERAMNWAVKKWCLPWLSKQSKHHFRCQRAPLWQSPASECRSSLPSSAASPAR